MQRPSGKQVVLGAALLGSGAALFGHVRYRSAMSEADRAFASVARPVRPTTTRFDPAMTAGLPEVARRYFAHAIAPGTPLSSVALLEMEGTFLLGDRDNYQTYAMKAREVLRAPAEFVWVPRLSSGLLTVSGSDGLAAGTAWTRFFAAGTVPVAAVETSPDMVRSAAFRLQPFGGTISAHRRFGGFTIPSEVAMGNHYGTADFLPFFQARITGASYR